MKKALVIILLVAVFTGCSRDVIENICPKSNPIDPYQMINNDQPYDDIVNKTYSVKEIQKIYIPALVQYTISDYPEASYLDDELGLKLIRKGDSNYFSSGYYTFYKMADSTLYVFFNEVRNGDDNELRIGFMFNLPHEPITTVEELKGCGASNYKKLVKLYPGVKLSPNEIVLQDYSLVLIAYGKSFFGNARITEIRTWGDNYYPSPKYYFYSILPMDLPEAYIEQSK